MHPGFGRSARSSTCSPRPRTTMTTSGTSPGSPCGTRSATIRPWDKITPRPGTRTAVADVALGIPTPGSAKFLLGYLTTSSRPGSTAATAIVGHVARYGAGDPQPALVALCRANQPAPGDRATFLKAIARGAQERGRAVSPEALAMAGEVAAGWLGSSDPDEVQAGVELAGAT